MYRQDFRHQSLKKFSILVDRGMEMGKRGREKWGKIREKGKKNG